MAEAVENPKPKPKPKYQIAKDLRSRLMQPPQYAYAYPLEDADDPYGKPKPKYQIGKDLRSRLMQPPQYADAYPPEDADDPYGGLLAPMGYGDQFGDLLDRSGKPRFIERERFYKNTERDSDSDSGDRFSSYIDRVKKKMRHSSPGGYASTSRVINRKEMVVDPDGDSSSLCTACRIPIFSTPAISFSHKGEQLFLHDQCATMLPEQVVHELHPNHALLLFNKLHHLPTSATTTAATSYCSNCNEVCGTMFYVCPLPGCDFRLDLICVTQIKIVHRSHHHSMVVIRQRDSASLTCSACDNRHEPAWSPVEPALAVATLSYLCNLCGYWIHPDCASLPNAIVHYDEHSHSLFLTYNLRTNIYSKCVICDNVLKMTSGGYICLKCDDYRVHIRCALTRPESFKPVFIRDAEVSDLARLPMPDENTSLIPYIKPFTRSVVMLVVNKLYQETLHEHTLNLHGIDDGDQSNSISRACNACVQFVSPPFLSCSQCPSFSLHTSCFHLPNKVVHRVHKHPLHLSPKAPKSDVSRSFYCKGCGVRSNGFAYSCKSCNDDYNLDVVCGLLNPAITHDAHKKTHILFMSREANFESDQICNCCGSPLSGICYECNICPKFKLHVRCALLPTTVSHSFDKHPLQLTTIPPKKRTDATPDGDEICEVCEEQMEKKKWHYSCGECDQSFHIDCIPAVDRLSRIKLGSTISVSGHGCPLTLVREEEAVCLGYSCGVCSQVLKFSDDGLAYECSKCFFGIHHECAEK